MTVAAAAPATPNAGQPENQDGVERHIDQRADTLDDHMIDGFSGGLHEPLGGEQKEHPAREQGANAQVPRTHG